MSRPIGFVPAMRDRSECIEAQDGFHTTRVESFDDGMATTRMSSTGNDDGLHKCFVKNTEVHRPIRQQPFDYFQTSSHLVD